MLRGGKRLNRTLRIKCERQISITSWLRSQRMTWLLESNTNYKDSQTLHFLKRSNRSLLINSRPHLSRLLLRSYFFYNSKNLNCIGALSFYDSKGSIGEVLFFNQFYWSDFWSGKWNAWNNLELNPGVHHSWFSSRKKSCEQPRVAVCLLSMMWTIPRQFLDCLLLQVIRVRCRVQWWVSKTFFERYTLLLIFPQRINHTVLQTAFRKFMIALQNLNNN